MTSLNCKTHTFTLVEELKYGAGNRYIGILFLSQVIQTAILQNKKNCCVNSRESKCFINDINKDFVQSNLLIHFVIFRERLH